jgi:methylphosphotriester-DNA--protein-cysteine methyltransferase
VVPVGAAVGAIPAAGLGAATASGSGAPASVPARDVWVADGYPDYHRAGCRELIGLDSEPVPHDQAVEDGFAPCAVCRPGAAEVPVLAPEPPPAAEEDDDLVPGLTRTDEFAPSEADDRARAREVWVADGYPDFHREGCAELAGLDAVAIPFDQAVDDDFQPCRVCQPQLAAAPEPAAPVIEAKPAPVAEADPAPVFEAEPEPVAAAEPEPAAEAEAEPAGSAQRVWVVDGRPRYHAQDCLIIKGQQAQAIPLDQAVEDGFKPCSLCQRER